MPGIGRDLLDVPFDEMVASLALAVAQGQSALDRNSVATLRELAATTVELITEITEVVDPVQRNVRVGADTITVTGAEITTTGVRTGRMSMVQAGFLPTFYQFTEVELEVQLAISMREESATDTQSPDNARAWKAYASSVDFRTQNTYSYSAQGASVLRAKMRPVPPPSRVEPSVTTINRLGGQTVVTRTPG